MNENRKNWLYPDASGLYFSHDGFVMNAIDGTQYDIEEECELLNMLSNDVEYAFTKLNKINQKLLEISNRDLLDIERIFLKNICKELKLSIFCCLNEDNFCNSCGECSRLIDDYNADIMRGLL